MSSLIFRFFVPYMFVCAGQPAAAGQGRCKQAEGETNASGQKRYAAVASGPERSPAGTAGRKRSPAVTAGRKRSPTVRQGRSEEHTSELQSLMRISYAVFCLKKKKTNNE